MNGSKLKRGAYSAAFKDKVLADLKKKNATVRDVAAKYKVDPGTIYYWRSGKHGGDIGRPAQSATFKDVMDKLISQDAEVAAMFKRLMDSNVTLSSLVREQPRKFPLWPFVTLGALVVVIFIQLMWR